MNVKVCFMTAAEINQEAIRELYPVRTIGGCFIKKPVEIDPSNQTVNSRVRIRKSDNSSQKLPESLCMF